MMSIRDGGLVPRSSQAAEEPESANGEDAEEENRGGGSATTSSAPSNSRKRDLVLTDPFILSKVSDKMLPVVSLLTECT
jgi:hypothetical protein